MRREDREVAEIEEIVKIIDKCKVLRLAMISERRAYIVAMNFGYEVEGDRFIFYLHSAADGRKIEALTSNPEVCLEMDREVCLIGQGAEACEYSFSYESVVAEGRAEFLTDENKKIYALSKIMKQQTQNENGFNFNAEVLKKTCVIAISCDVVSAKKNVK